MFDILLLEELWPCFIIKETYYLVKCVSCRDNRNFKRRGRQPLIHNILSNIVVGIFKYIAKVEKYKIDPKTI